MLVEVLTPEQDLSHRELLCHLLELDDIESGAAFDRGPRIGRIGRIDQSVAPLHLQVPFCLVQLLKCERKLVDDRILPMCHRMCEGNKKGSTHDTPQHVNAIAPSPIL